MTLVQAEMIEDILFSGQLLEGLLSFRLKSWQRLNNCGIHDLKLFNILYLLQKFSR